MKRQPQNIPRRIEELKQAMASLERTAIDVTRIQLCHDGLTKTQSSAMSLCWWHCNNTTAALKRRLKTLERLRDKP